MESSNDIIDGRYKIIETIGKGGMSVVYKAINIKLNNVWTIKEVTLDPKAGIDFLAEPNILKHLDHTALPRIVDIISEKNKLYIVMDYIDGTSLNVLLEQSMTIPEEKIVTWAKELCEVLRYLHSQPNPIIYRDMKPGNIMLTKEGKIKLIDFGIARQYKENSTADTVIIGTRGYAAPEQYGNHQTDVRTDIYSLGITLYHLVTGKGPNDPPYELVPVRDINDKLSQGIEYIIAKCTQQDPKQRYQKVDELIYDLENIDSLSEEYILKQRRKIGKMFIISSIFFAIVAVGGFVKVVSTENDQYISAIDKANLYIEQADTNKAIEILKEEIENSPSKNDAYLELADIYITNSEYSKAITFLSIEAPESNKGILQEDKYYYLLGMACFSKADYKSAYENFEKIKEEDFQGLQYYSAISEVFSNPSSIEKNDKVVEYIKDLQSYLDKLDDQLEKSKGYLILSDIYRYNPKVFDNSDDMQIKLLEDAKSKSNEQGNISIYDRLGQAYYSKALSNGDNEEQYNKYLNLALENYNAVMKLGYSSSSTYRNIGVINKSLNNYEKAENSFNLLVKNYPNDFKGYIELAKLYYEFESKKSLEERDYSKFISNYELAEKNNTVESNFELEKIRVLYNEIKK
jgi:serine/threonine-protein kinase